MPECQHPVIVVGGANMDISAMASSAPRAGDSIPGNIRYAPGGVGRNMAENLARLGIPVHLLTLVGDDAFGHAILDASAAVGVKTVASQVLAGQRTASYVSMHGPDGDVAMAVNDMAILDALTPARCAHALPTLPADAMLLLDCNLPAPTLTYLLGLGRTTAVDGVSVTKCRRIASVLDRIGLLKLNHLEAAELCGIPVLGVEDALRAVRALQQQGAQQVVLSVGEQGVCWARAGEMPHFTPAHPVKVLNTTGAGDALMAGLVAAFQRGAGLKEAVRYGMACAEITLSSTFANSPDLNDAAVRQQLTLSV